MSLVGVYIEFSASTLVNLDTSHLDRCHVIDPKKNLDAGQGY